MKQWHVKVCAEFEATIEAASGRKAEAILLQRVKNVGGIPTEWYKAQLLGEEKKKP